MRILFTIGGFGRGGKERRMLSLMEYLAFQGFELGMIGSVQSPQWPEAARLCERTYDYRRGEAGFNFREHVRAVKEFQPDVIHSWNRSCTVWGLLAAIGRKCPVVTSEVTNTHPMRLVSEEFATTRFNFQFAARVLSNSKAGLEVKRVPRRKGGVIYNGYRMSRLKEVDAVKYVRFSDAEVLNVVMAARFTPEKDHASVLCAAEMAQEAGLPIRFVLAGEGPTLEGFRKEAADRGVKNVDFSGYVADIDNLLHHMDVGVLMTDSAFTHEGISNAVVEYMAHGMPVVITAGPSAGETVREGVDGYIIGDRNPEELFKKLKLLAENRDLVRKLGRSAHRVVADKFNLERMGQEFARLYREMGNRNRSNVSVAALQE